jgi:glycosyltransferase involved in cell wall biosynthesis
LLKVYKPCVLKYVLRAASFVVVFTQDQRAEMHQQYGIAMDRLRALPNGVEQKFYRDRPRTLHAKPRLVFVGRLQIQKNLQMLLRALDGVSEQFQTTLVGDGIQAAELKALAKDLKLQNVTFAGRADGAKLHQYYQDADVFVLPSEREGMPLVLLEAMAMGLPIVATNVTGNRDVVQDGKNGYLVPLDDIAAFRKALQKATASQTAYIRLSQQSRTLSNQYSWPTIAAQFDELYKESHA